MYEEFDEQARSALSLAQEEARALGHSWVGTEHLLLGVLRGQDDVAAAVLERLAVTYERARNQVARINGVADTPVTGELPLSPRGTEALEQAEREAYELRSGVVRTAHLMLGLLDERESLAVRVLADAGVAPEQVRAELLRAIPPIGEQPPGEDGPAESPADRMPIPNLALEHEHGTVPFTPQARAVLELAHDEALLRGDTAVAPEHLLVALVRCADPVASATLLDMGATAESIRAEVARRRAG
ncbi:MAG: ATP-dependent Clp protease ATP-binding subunit ClpC [Solirubrobacteraceae bacterium]|jgi:ATP-dependent Clp protease ATP-binding subunit ClpA|nr:ATP-dependent Clp protease ATP-binding subunit ClpC [Solirubrobacteraceae bacterium]